jgi:hypothetical protein
MEIVTQVVQHLHSLTCGKKSERQKKMLWHNGLLAFVRLICCEMDEVSDFTRENARRFTAPRELFHHLTHACEVHPLRQKQLRRARLAFSQEAQQKMRTTHAMLL